MEKKDKIPKLKIIRHRDNYSKTHIMSSTLLLQKCYDIEISKESKYPDVFFLYQAYVINSIFSTVAFLESFINEFYSNSVEVPQVVWRKKKPSKRNLSRITGMWNLEIPRTASYPIPKKYQIALILTDNEPFSNQDPLFQKIFIITKLRNELIHFEPKWNDNFDDPEEERKKMTGVGKQLQHEKFSLNPFVPKGADFFPSKCLGYGCAKWANENSLEFVKKFCEKMEIPFSYEEEIKMSLNK